ncbi:hypothetical protein [Aquitalea sp. ASV11]|uniref:hypothetical protein n=1 Tax=Aquitalea sp. ASV11 TaxID=2795103 RepID=UPI0018EC3946|nr:hypothetical protein [Aquitalea sp. ASV11]
MPNLLLPIATFLALLLTCMLIGLLANKRILRQADIQIDNPSLTLSLAATSGYVCFSLLLFVLGLLQLLTPLGIIAGLAILLALLFDRSCLALGNLLRQYSRLEAVLILLGLGCFLLLPARASGHSDDTMYHLPLALGYAHHAALYINPYIRFPLFPQFSELLMSTGFVFLDKEQGTLVAQSWMAMPVFIMWLGVKGLLDSKVSGKWPGFIALTMLGVLAPLKHTLGYAYIDQVLALYCFAMSAAFICLFNAPQLNKRWYMLVALYAGAAIGTKYFGVVYVAGAYLAILLFGRDLRSVLGSGMLSLVVGGGWYLRAFLISGDPIHPAGGNIFGYYLWNAQDLLAQKAEQATYGTHRTLQYIPSAIAKAGMKSMMLIPCILYRWPRLNKGERAALLGIILYFMFWFFVTQVDRYLAPISGIGIYLLCLMAADIAAWLSQYREKKSGSKAYNWRWVGTFLMVAVLVNLVHKTALQVRDQYNEWQQILESRSGYDLFAFANTQRAKYGNSLVNIDLETLTFYFDGMVYGQHFGPGRFSALRQCNRGKCHLIPANEMKQYLQSHHSKLLITPNGMIADSADYNRLFTTLYHSKNGMVLALR